MKAVVIRGHGGPEVLEVADVPEPEVPRDGIVVDVRAAGVNRVDVLVRSGAYHGGVELPAVPGREASGVVRAAGEGQAEFRPGDRVLVFSPEPGGYAERVSAPARSAVKLPEGIDFPAAAALPTAWLTAWYCLVRLARLRPDETLLIQAAASGVGDAATQIGRHLGARVIAAAGSAHKIAFALGNGAESGIDYSREDVAAEVLVRTGGRGADVVLDAVGGRLFPSSLRALGHFGRCVALANPTLEDSVVNTRDFYPKNASIHGFQLGNLVALGGYDPRPDLAELAGLVAAGKLTVHIERAFPLEQAVEAHRLLESRAVRGKVILLARVP